MRDDDVVDGLASLVAHQRAEAVSHVVESTELRRALRRADAEAEQRVGELDRTRSETDALRDDLAAARRSLDDAEAALARSEAENDRGRREAAVVEDELRRERARIRTLQTSLADVRSSLSWRVTRPLRALRR